MKNAILKAAAAAITAAAVTLCGFADSSGFREGKTLVLPLKTPYETKYTNVAWNTGEAETAGVPTAAEGGVYFPSGNKVRLLSAKDGSELASAELNEKVSEGCGGALLGNTLVQPTRTGIAAINTADMSVITARSFGGEIITDAAAADGLVYFGAKNGEEYVFYCADLSDGLKTVWEYRSDAPVSAPALYGGYVLFSSGTALVCHEQKSDSYNEIDIGTQIVGAPFAGDYAVFLSGADGNVYKLRLTDEGTLEEDTLTPCEVGGELSSPLAWNGRVYVSAAEGFFILDSLNMEVMSSFPEIKTAGEPLVCCGNGPRVYAVAPENDYWCLYSIYDADDSKPVLSRLAKLEDFSGGRFTAGRTVSGKDSGTMYFRDAKGRLYALAEAPYNILYIVLKLVCLVGLIVLVFLILRAWVKRRAESRPPQF